MYVLFGKYLYPKILFYIGVLRSVVPKPREFTEILIINVNENTIVRHGNIDTLLLNATAVSDLKKTLRKKYKLRTALRAQSSQRNIRHIW